MRASGLSRHVAASSPLQVILVDGNGVLHPRGLGLAAHLGVVADVPTVSRPHPCDRKPTLPFVCFSFSWGSGQWPWSCCCHGTAQCCAMGVVRSGLNPRQVGIGKTLLHVDGICTERYATGSVLEPYLSHLPNRLRTLPCYWPALTPSRQHFVEAVTLRHWWETQGAPGKQEAGACPYRCLSVYLQLLTLDPSLSAWPLGLCAWPLKRMCATGPSSRGAAVRSTDGSPNPIYVSIGHRVSLDTAIRVATSCCKYRIPEPVRQADQRSRTFLRDLAMAGDAPPS